jgi:hypothetical protein
MGSHQEAAREDLGMADQVAKEARAGEAGRDQ